MDTTTRTRFDPVVDTTRRLTRLALTAVILFAAFAGWWLWAPSGPTASPHPTVDEGMPSDVTAGPTIGATPALADGAPVDATVTLHVSGEVATPGLVEVAAGGRVADAIAAAGGALPAADLTALNLAAPVGDGAQIHVPAAAVGGGGAGLPGEGTAPGGGGGTTGDGLVRVNQADAAALETLPGVGPVLAQRIIAHREEAGPFGTVEDLLDVPGIGEGRLEAIRDLVAIP